MTTEDQAAPRPSWWQRNAWNRPLSWWLVMNLTPRLPRPVVWLLHHVLSVACFLTMGRQRVCVFANLRRITGLEGLALVRMAYRTFHCFSRFMVAYTEVVRLGQGAPLPPLRGEEEAREVLDKLLAERRGLIVMTAHLGQWDLGLKLLSRLGSTVHVAMREMEGLDVSRHASTARAAPTVVVHQSGASSMLGLKLALALRRGDIVAVQGDRPVGHHDVQAKLFGAPALLTTGAVRLAWATGAPILPVFILLDGRSGYRLVTGDPIRLERPREETREAIDTAMANITQALEDVISRHPEQWFSFHDPWAA